MVCVEEQLQHFHMGVIALRLSGPLREGGLGSSLNSRLGLLSCDVYGNGGSCGREAPYTASRDPTKELKDW